MCTPQNPVPVMRTSSGLFAKRAWQACVVILDLEKAMQGSQPNDQDIRGGIDFCEAVLSGGRWFPETSPVDLDSADSVALFAELQRHAGLVERTEGVMETLRRLVAGDESGMSPDQMRFAQEFFLKALEAINIARDLNPS